MIQVKTFAPNLAEPDLETHVAPLTGCALTGGFAMSQPELVLGVPLMDEDHARLEALFASIAGTPDNGLPALFDAAEAETKAHFEREEQLMRAADFPVLFCHVAQHKMILAEFENGRRAKDASDTAELRRFLTRTLPGLVSAHVASVDRVTAGFLKGEIVPGDLAELRLDNPHVHNM
jgi:hemerythrin-like metal-binding protein